MTQQRKPHVPPHDEVKFVNGVWVIVDKSSVKSFGFHYGPFKTEKLALAAFEGGK